MYIRMNIHIYRCTHIHVRDARACLRVCVCLCVYVCICV